LGRCRHAQNRENSQRAKRLTDSRSAS
jgi:hypothetical protein